MTAPTKLHTSDCAIRPQHYSMLGKRKLPHNMTATELPHDQREFLDKFAIQIFTDCVNNGHTFQAALSVVYLSGLQNGMALHKEVSP